MNLAKVNNCEVQLAPVIKKRNLRPFAVRRKFLLHIKFKGLIIFTKVWFVCLSSHKNRVQRRPYLNLVGKVKILKEDEIMKKRVTLLVGMMAVVFAGVAQAETRLAVQNAAGTDKMVVTDTGRIGVGGVGSLAGSGAGVPDAGIYIKGSAYPDNTIRLEGNATTGGAGYLGYLIKPSFVLPLNNERLGFFLFGSASNATTPLHSTGITASAEGDWTSISNPSNFTFATTPAGSTARTERLRISASGNVGINTATPTQKLEVNGGVRINTATAHTTCDSTTTRGTIWFTAGGTGVADTFEVCAKDISGNYAWRKLY